MTTKAGWCAVIPDGEKMAVERRPTAVSPAYEDADTLRSMSDKALDVHRSGQWRITEHLRDALRSVRIRSVGTQSAQFFIEVYRHLRERIAPDIIKTMIRLTLLNRWKSSWHVATDRTDRP